jgi:hypothetical protein
MKSINKSKKKDIKTERIKELRKKKAKTNRYN